MNLHDVIVRPIITEKTSSKMSTNVYTFEVHPDSTKDEIKKAIEIIFAASKVKVEKVNTINVKPRKKSLGKYNGWVRGYKKAMVFLTEGSIPVFGKEDITPASTGKKKRKNRILPNEGF